MSSHCHLQVTPPSDSTSESAAATSHGPREGLNISQSQRESQGEVRQLKEKSRGYYATTIDTLTDNVLLDIFDICRKNDDGYHILRVWKWHILVQICRRWRQIIFSSPRRLDLRIVCTDGTPVRKNLGIWPAIPIVMQYYTSGWELVPHDDDDNIIAALEHPDRVSRISLEITKSQLGKVAAVMREPFPVLTDLCIHIDEDDEIDDSENAPPVIPTGFLGGPAPYLQSFQLSGIAFPALPTFILSASDLVVLRLQKIPLTGYISPEAMVAYLAALPMLKTLHVEFQSVTSGPDQMFLLPQTRTVFPALSSLYLSDVDTCGYSKDFVARIDAPQLDSIWIYYSGQAADFEIPQLSEFINRSANLKDTLSSHCQLMLREYNYDETGVDFYILGAVGRKADGVFNTGRCDTDTGISVGTAGVWVPTVDQMSELTHALGWISPILSDMVHFTIHSSYIELVKDLDNIEWLHLLFLFPSVQTLFVSRQVAGHISHTLDDIDGVLVTEVLPALELLCLEGQPLSSIDQFLALRRDSGHPVTRVNTEKEFEKRRKSYP